MLKSLFFVIIAFLFLCCGNNEKNAGSLLLPVKSLEVDFTPELSAELKSLGFILPSKEIKAPEFTLKDLAGQEKSLSSFQGKLVFLNFWGSWCVFCRQEMPSMQRLYDTLKTQGFEIVSVNVDDPEETARAYILKNNLTFPVLLDTDYIATGSYGVRSFPTTFIIDREGFLRAKLVGAREWYAAEVLATFQKIIGAQ